MKNLKSFTVGLITGVALLGVVGTSFAGSALKKIEAYIVNDQKITVDGSNAKTNNPVLTYNNSRYVSIRDVSKLVGADIAYKNGVIELETPNVDNNSQSNTQTNNPVTNSTSTPNNSQTNNTNGGNTNTGNSDYVSSEPSYVGDTNKMVKDKNVGSNESVSVGNYKFSVSDYSYSSTPNSSGYYSISYKVNVEAMNGFTIPDGDLTIWTNSYQGSNLTGGISSIDIQGIGKSKSIDIAYETITDPSLVDQIEVSTLAKSGGEMLVNVKWTIK